MSRRLWKLGMSSFACSLEQAGRNPTISSYWWIFPRGNILIHWVIHWANEPSIMHCHPPWGPALKRERDVLRPSYVQVFYQKEMNFGNSFFFSQGKAKYRHYKVILNPALPSSGSCSLCIGLFLCTSWALMLRLTGKYILGCKW